MAIRLPTVFPLMVTEWIGWASGESALTTMESSHGKSSPSATTCRRKSSTVFSVGMRVNLNGAAISQLKLAHDTIDASIGQVSVCVFWKLPIDAYRVP